MLDKEVPIRWTFPSLSSRLSLDVVNMQQLQAVTQFVLPQWMALQRV